MKTMSTKTFTKPAAHFPSLPVIFLWIKSAYDKVETYEHFAHFIHGCLTEAENTTNEVKRSALNGVAMALYSADTNRSFESKDLEILANSR